jgi:hypothetical protein
MTGRRGLERQGGGWISAAIYEIQNVLSNKIKTYEF